MAQVYVALDLEMTGQDYVRDEIIQIGAIKFDERRVLGRWQSLVRPPRSVPYKITRLTGIRPRDLQTAPLFENVRSELADFLGGYPVVGHSVGHDCRFLMAKGMPVSNPEYDTWELATLLIPSLSTYSLHGVAEALGVAPSGSEHDAMADAELSRRVFLSLLAKLRKLHPELLNEVAGLAQGSGWPLHSLFSLVRDDLTVRTPASTVSGSIAAQLLAKGLSEEDLTRSLLAPRERVPALEPAAEPAPLDPGDLSSAFAPGGALASSFPGYEQRPQQVEMMRAVAEAFNDEHPLVVEAGTGTGKSLAYLYPAVLWALRNGERVVISTDTINLQDQLYNKDIPDIRRALGTDGRGLRATPVKGRSNYLCLKRWEAYRRSGNFTPDEVRFVAKVLFWLPNTLTGDVAELPLSQEERIHWLKVCATRGTCTGRYCQFADGKHCFLYRARQAAEGSHLIVVNHSLMLSDIAANSKVLPSYSYLVVDEAHTLESEATDQLGFSLDARALNDHLDRISKPVPPDRHEGLASSLPVHLRGSRVSTDAANQVLRLSGQLADWTASVRARTQEFFATLARATAGSEQANGYDARVRLTPEVRMTENWTHTLVAWDNLKLTLTDLQAGIQQARSLFEEMEGLNVLQYDEVLAELQAIEQTNREMLDHTDAILAHPRAEDVYWISLSGRTGALSLHQAPLHVGALLQEHLYSQKKSVILTSATLTTDRSFAYIEDRLGLEEPHRLVVGSPFDYRSSTLLLIADDVPEPGSPGYQRALEAALVDLVLAAGGRCLVLFTSHSAVQLTLKGIHRQLAQQDILVLAHGDGPRHRLLQQFKSNPRTVLLGTRSFWEGVDVVGEALSLLVIAKLPFDVPTDPVFVARGESFDDPFNDFSVPQAILRLKQGFGRLIRSSTDRGVVVALDRRLLTKRYGNRFLRSLPPCTLRKGPADMLPEQVESWLGARVVAERSSEVVRNRSASGPV